MVGGDRGDVFRDRNPEVGRHGDLQGTEQVDVLGHPRIAGLQRQGFDARHVIFEVDAGLEAEVGTALDREERRPKAGVHGQVPGEGVFVFAVEGQFVAVIGIPVLEVVVLRLGRGCAGGGRFDGRQGLRLEGMVEVFTAETNDPARGRMPVKVRPGVPVADAGAVGDIVNVFLDLAVIQSVEARGNGTEVHPVAVEGDGRVGEKARGEDVVPAQVDDVVAPAGGHLVAGEAAVAVGNIVGIAVFLRNPVGAGISTEVEAVAVAEAPGELAVEVVEIIVGVDVGAAEP